MANAPLPPRDGRSYAVDLGENESRIFLREGLDRFWVICPSCQFVAGRRMKLRLCAKQISTQCVMNCSGDSGPGVGSLARATLAALAASGAVAAKRDCGDAALAQTQALQ